MNDEDMLEFGMFRRKAVLAAYDIMLARYKDPLVALEMLRLARDIADKRGDSIIYTTNTLLGLLDNGFNGRLGG